MQRAVGGTLLFYAKLPHLVSAASDRSRIHTTIAHLPSLVDRTRATRVPVPPTLLTRLWLGLIAGALSFALTEIQSVVRAGYDPWQQAMSALSLGPHGWVQMLNMIGFGIAVLTTVEPWRRILRGDRGETWYPILTALLGASFVVVGLVVQDPAPGYDPDGRHLTAMTGLGITHIAVGGVAALSSVLGFLVMAARFAGDSTWRGWALYSWLTAAVVVVAIAGYVVYSVESTGFAGTFERAAMVAPIVWMYAFLRRLSQGRPFMVLPDDSRRRCPTAVPDGSAAIPGQR